uniref:NADH-ubiquinone oxidoreductase chain 4L n=1 Tax=Tylosurus melanotus TaxID=3053213 RepID=A0A160ED76_9TELE|nr:NADH dehydrogenase subunit 4L [Tylosurus acus melanotus]
MSPIQSSFSSMLFLGLSGLTLHRTDLLTALVCLDTMMLSVFIVLSFWLLQLVSTTISPCPMMQMALSAREVRPRVALLVVTASTQRTDLVEWLKQLQC